MRVLVTGATGLIGSELVSLLLQNGVSVHYLTTSKSKIENHPNYKGFFWNPGQGIIDENCLMAVDAIIHLAGASISERWTEAYKEEIIESRVVSSNMLFKALKDNPNHQVKQIVSASAMGIYPNSRSEIYTEDSKAVDDSFLGQVVVKWEESLDKFKMLNIKVCKLRTGLVLSDKGGAMAEMLKPINIGLGTVFGNGKQIQSWIHLHDLAAMYSFAVENCWEGIYNAVAPNPVTNKDLTRTIARVMQKPIFLMHIPKFIMKLLLGEMHELLFNNKYLSCEKVMAKGFQFKYTNVDEALKNLLA